MSICLYLTLSNVTNEAMIYSGGIWGPQSLRFPLGLCLVLYRALRSHSYLHKVNFGGGAWVILTEQVVRVQMWLCGREATEVLYKVYLLYDSRIIISLLFPISVVPSPEGITVLQLWVCFSSLPHQMETVILKFLLAPRAKDVSLCAD